MNGHYVHAALAQEVDDVAADELVGVVLDREVAGILRAARARYAGPLAQARDEPLALERRQTLSELDVGDLQIADAFEHDTLPLVDDAVMLPEAGGSRIAEDAYACAAAR